jgi:Xaa-Pro aminopeptidase
LHYTAVLKGFLSMLTLQFPSGTQGHQIDAFARRALWELGLDFDHGTGHGVGHQLLIHEQPHRIAKKVNPWPLVAGNIMTIEPGYYLADRYGIRIENQVEVVESQPGFCRFSSLTLVPVDLSQVEWSLLSNEKNSGLIPTISRFATRFHRWSTVMREHGWMRRQPQCAHIWVKQ